MPVRGHNEADPGAKTCATMSRPICQYSKTSSRFTASAARYWASWMRLFSSASRSAQAGGAAVSDVGRRVVGMASSGLQVALQDRLLARGRAGDDGLRVGDLHFQRLDLGDQALLLGQWRYRYLDVSHLGGVDVDLAR